jgi:hypothetical protein
MSCSGESLDPVILRRIFLLATQTLFSNPENYGESAEDLSRYKFSEDEAERTLSVELDYVYNPANLSARHAVYVGCGNMDFAAHVLNNNAGINDDRSATVSNQQASTTVGIRFVTPLPDESLRLATIAMGYYAGMRIKFMEELQLLRFDLVQISAPSLVEKAPVALYEVTLAIRLAFSFEVTSFVEGHRIKTFSVATASSGGA